MVIEVGDFINVFDDGANIGGRNGDVCSVGSLCEKSGEEEK